MNILEEAPVCLSLPNDPAFLRIVRLVVASLAADVGFDYEEVEDLRIAADELVNLVMFASAAHGSIRVEIFLDHHSLLLRASGPERDSGAVHELDPLASQIVTAIVESFEIGARDGRIEVGFRARQPVGSIGG